MRPEHVCCLVREFSGFWARLEVPTAGHTKWFPFTTDGKQGGVETPDEFNVFLESALTPVVVSWTRREFGFEVGDGARVKQATLIQREGEDTLNGEMCL